MTFLYIHILILWTICEYVCVSVCDYVIINVIMGGQHDEH